MNTARSLPPAGAFESAEPADWEEDEEMSGPVSPFVHKSVMLREVIEALSTRPGGVFVDVTLGGGGHSEALLEADPSARVYGFDRDPRALAAASERLARFGDRFRAEKASFAEVLEVLARLGVTRVDGLMADFGVSSPQLDDPGRGMSFRLDGPLDMRMDTTEGETAAELIRRLSADDLANIIFTYGEERRSRRIARCVKQADEAGELNTTLDLRRAVVRAVGPARIGGVDPATKSFQALRIAVNDELGQVEALLNAAPELVAPGGVFAVLSFHSLEDRLAKRALYQQRSIWSPLFRKPKAPTDEECLANPRARSAKLRAVRRVDESFDGDGDGNDEGDDDGFEPDAWSPTPPPASASFSTVNSNTGLLPPPPMQTLSVPPSPSFPLSTRASRPSSMPPPALTRSTLPPPSVARARALHVGTRGEGGLARGAPPALFGAVGAGRRRQRHGLCAAPGDAEQKHAPRL